MIPQEVLTLSQDISATHIFANMEYEVDELRRDIKLCELIQDAQNKGENAPRPSLHHDYVLVKPGTVTTGADKPYSVFSPFHRNWSSKLQADLEEASREYSGPEANEDSARTDKKLADLFASKVPEAIEGFELPSDEYRETVHALFPPGTDAAEEVGHAAASTSGSCSTLICMCVDVSGSPPLHCHKGKGGPVCKVACGRNAP